jgi:hypothetical protein
MDNTECAICISSIGDKNKVVTDCGHTFHASCLMQHISYNGYGCPCCRTMMVSENNTTTFNTDSQNQQSNDINHSIDINPPIDYIMEYIHRNNYGYEDLVKIICNCSHIPYYRNSEDSAMTYVFFTDLFDALEMYQDVENDMSHFDEIEEVDSV